MERDILSQEELDALLRGGTSEPEPESELEPASKYEVETESLLTSIQIDALGEIGNITYGAASTALSELLNKRVIIDTPSVLVSTQRKIKENYSVPYLIVEVNYRDGLLGSNVLIVKIEDASIIAALMMGAESAEAKSTLDQMELSAVGEAMNQMIGSASTSLATLFGRKIQIDSPQNRMVDFDNEEPIIRGSQLDAKVTAIAFKLQIANLIDSEIMLLIPVEIAIDMADALIDKTVQMSINILVPEPVRQEPPIPITTNNAINIEQPKPKPIPIPIPVPVTETVPVVQTVPITPPTNNEYNVVGNSTGGFQNTGRSQIKIQPAQFVPLGAMKSPKEGNNFGLLFDVPLNVVVELGTATMKIKEILDLVPGSIIELNKIAGDMVDVHINQKLVAKGEVVVIDENFGIKITDIVSPLERVVNQNPMLNTNK